MESRLIINLYEELETIKKDKRHDIFIEFRIAYQGDIKYMQLSKPSSKLYGLNWFTDPVLE
jgi:hypothetical protein